MREDNGNRRVLKSSSVAVKNKVESWRKRENSLFFRTVTNINNNEKQVWMQMQEIQSVKHPEEKVNYYLNDDFMTIEIIKVDQLSFDKDSFLEGSLGLCFYFETL